MFARHDFFCFPDYIYWCLSSITIFFIYMLLRLWLGSRGVLQNARVNNLRSWFSIRHFGGHFAKIVQFVGKRTFRIFVTCDKNSESSFAHELHYFCKMPAKVPNGKSRTQIVNAGVLQNAPTAEPQPKEHIYEKYSDRRQASIYIVWETKKIVPRKHLRGTIL